MFSTRALARVAVPVLVATTMQTVVAEDSVGTTPPAKSIREWKPNPTAAPAAQTVVAGDSVGPTLPAKSIREWRTSPIAAPAVNPCSTPTASPMAMPAVAATTPKTPITISIRSKLREGSLVVLLDDVPIFNEKFQKPMLVISQTTTWDPLQVAAGKHRLSAKVYGAKKTYISSLYDLEVSRTRTSALRFVIRGDKLIVELAS